MTTVRLRELPDWPPAPGGAYDSLTRFPVGGEARVNEVFPVRDKRVTFRGVFEGNPSSYHYVAPSEQTAERIYDAIAANLGKKVGDLGDVEIEV
jgi:hypothetical protein